MIGSLPVDDVISTSWVMSPDIVELRGDLLLCKAWPPVRRKPTTAMYVDFFELAEASNEGIFAYAKKWGLLVSPGTMADLEREPQRFANQSAILHPPTVDPEHDLEGVTEENPYGFYRVPVMHWRSISRRFCGIRNVLLALESGKTGTVEEIAAMWDRPPSFVKELLKERGIRWVRGVATRSINEFVIESGLHPFIVWDRDKKRWTVELNCIGCSNLLAILTLRLLLAASDTDRFAICSYCNRPFAVAGRRPPEGQTRCCGKRECITKRWRDYKRRKPQKD
jgi:hypothetical protein